MAILVVTFAPDTGLSVLSATTFTYSVPCIPDWMQELSVVVSADPVVVVLKVLRVVVFVIVDSLLRVVVFVIVVSSTEVMVAVTVKVPSVEGVTVELREIRTAEARMKAATTIDAARLL